MSFRALLAVTCAVVCSASASGQNLNPSWTYASYFGGSGADTAGVETKDSAGNIYIAGVTSSTNFPTTAGTYEPTFPGPSGSSVMYVSKFSSAGSLIWSTYLGPGCFQFSVPNGLAVDSNENVYVSGIYECSGYPTTVNLGTSGSVFLTKLNASASQLVYSTTLGGNSVLATSEVVLDSDANAYVIGAGDYCCNSGTGIIGPLGGISDFWVAQVNSAGNAIPWSVEIGGTDLDVVYGISIDEANKLYLTGYTASTNFPTTSGALDQPGTARAFITKLDPSKPPTSSMVYSALAGNPGNTSNQLIEGTSIAVDASGDAYIAAWTYNSGLITSPNAFQRVAPPVPNGYVFELNPSGSAITNGTYIGGGANDFLKGIAVDSSGNTYLSGSTNSWNFPTTAYGNSGRYKDQLGFYVKLNPQFAAISSVEIGPNDTGAFGATTDASGGLWISGYTVAGFPTTPNAYQPNYGGGTDDGYLVHTDFEGLCSPTAVEICTLAQDPNNPERIHVASQAANMDGAMQIQLYLDGQQAYAVNAAQFDTWLPVAPGNHTAKVTAYSVNQPPQTTQEAFNVTASSTCPLNPIAPSLTICSPLNAAVVNGTLNAAVVKGTVNIVIQANDSTPPNFVYLYIDNKPVARLSNQNGTYRYTTILAAGSHSVAVRGTDSNNDLLQSSAVFKVSN